MKNIKGFTLIELLVVVLIIAILAAIALPQYRKVIYKSRMVQMQAYIDAIIKAQEIHYLTYGYNADNINELDIDFSIPSQYIINLSAKHGSINYIGTALSMIIYFPHTTHTERGFKSCRVTCGRSDTDLVLSVCKQATGKNCSDSCPYYYECGF